MSPIVEDRFERVWQWGTFLRMVQGGAKQMPATLSGSSAGVGAAGSDGLFPYR